MWEEPDLGISCSDSFQVLYNLQLKFSNLSDITSVVSISFLNQSLLENATSIAWTPPFLLPTNTSYVVFLTVMKYSTVCY